MRGIVICMLLFSLFTYGQERKYFSENYEFKPGEVAYLFGNDVKLRKEPNTDSDVLQLLEISTKVEIIEKTKFTMLFEGRSSPWYKIKHEDSIGYTLGALISLNKISYNDLTYLISLKKEKEKLYLKTRLLEKDKNYIENISELLTGEFSVKAYGNKGLENIKSIFFVDYLAESCGVDGGGRYLFFDGDRLINAIDFSRIADADTYWLLEEYIFPSDLNGKKGKILYKKEVGQTKDYETNWTESVFTQRILEWKDSKITPNMTIELND